MLNAFEILMSTSKFEKDMKIISIN